MTKKIIFIVLLFSISLSSIGQAGITRDAYYLVKSRNQKTAAFITLGCTAATLVPGIILLNQVRPGWENVDWMKALGGTGLVIVGTGFAITSFILFISSSQNKKKADKLALTINKPVPVNTELYTTTLPYSVGLTVSIR